MKKIFSFLPLLALAILFAYSCNTGGSGAAYTIKMRLNKGDTFNQDIQMNMLMNTSGMEMNMKMNTGSSFEVTNSDPVAKNLKMTYTKMDMSMDMGKLSKMKNMSDSIMKKNSNYVVGKSIILTMSKDNEITNVSGFDELMDNQPRDSAGRQMMKKMFSKDQFNSMFGMMFSMYPKKPVQVGESWNSDTKMTMSNMDMKVSNKYTLLSVKNGLAEIGIDGTIGSNGEMLKQPSGMKMDMSGTQKGTVTIRMDNGYLHAGSYKMEMKAEMQMMGQKIPMTMKTDYTLKGI